MPSSALLRRPCRGAGCAKTAFGGGEGSGIHRRLLRPEFPLSPVIGHKVSRNRVACARPTSAATVIPRNPPITFGEVAAHYIKFELPDDQSDATIEKITNHDHRVQTLSEWLGSSGEGAGPTSLPKWKTGVRKSSENTSLKAPPSPKVEKVMNLVYRHDQRHGILDPDR
jgi:hypothetical protein